MGNKYEERVVMRGRERQLSLGVFVLSALARLRVGATDKPNGNLLD